MRVTTYKGFHISVSSNGDFYCDTSGNSLNRSLATNSSKQMNIIKEAIDGLIPEDVSSRNITVNKIDMGCNHIKLTIKSIAGDSVNFTNESHSSFGGVNSSFYKDSVETTEEFKLIKENAEKIKTLGEETIKIYQRMDEFRNESREAIKKLRPFLIPSGKIKEYLKL